MAKYAKPYTDKAMHDHANTYLSFKAGLRWSIAVILVALIGLIAFVYN